jgi:hypothetical protein
VKTYTPEELKAVLDAHRAWLSDSVTGSRADLSWADLSGADLSGADLSRADLSGANLSGANLSRADLSRADLSGANLSGANLSRASLSRANLSGANLSRANLSGANLSGALTWEQYLSEVVPALLTAGGKTLAEVLATGCWQCHSWENCPTHAALGANSLAEVPAPWRLEAARFIELFDAGAIPMPVLPESGLSPDA